MKSTKEIASMLGEELVDHLDKIESGNFQSGYNNNNNVLGDTSFLLAGLLYSVLKTKYKDWGDDKWIDDSLLSDARVKGSEVIIEGVMIFGRQGTNQQWVDLFYFTIKLAEEVGVDTDSFSFLFGTTDKYISYEDFIEGHKVFDKSLTKDWKYKVISTVL